jgi:hypothetical protein
MAVEKDVNMKVAGSTIPALCVLLLQAGCATMVPDHTLFLGEVAHVATPDDVLKGVKLGHDNIAPPTMYLENCKSESGKQGKFVLVRFSYFWTSASSPVHNNANWAIVPDDLAPNQGSIVELDIGRSKQNPDIQCPVVKAIRFQDFKSGMCEYRVDSRGIMGTVVDFSQALIGGRGSRSIYCPDLATEGWEFVRHGPEKAMAWKKMPQ